MKFPIKRSDLYVELQGMGYKESTRIDSANQVLLSENRGTARNTITVKGNGIKAMTGLTNQNRSITVKSPTELVTYQTTYTKQSAISLDVGLTDDVKLNQFIQASGISPSLFIDVRQYTIEVDTDGNLRIRFTDIFEPGLIMLPLIDGNIYQLDQLDKLGAATDPVMRFATNRSFTKAQVLANRKLVPGGKGTYFIPLVMRVQAIGDFPNFTVEAVAPDSSMASMLAIGPQELINSPLTVGWMGVNALTDAQFLPSAPSPLNVALTIREFKVSEMSLSYANATIIDALKALSTNRKIAGYDQYTSTITGPSADQRTLALAFKEDYDKTNTHALQVYELPASEIASLNDTASNGDLVVLRIGAVALKASEVIGRLVENQGKFYFGYEVSITEVPQAPTFNFNVGGLDNTATDWTPITWTTTTNQTLPKDLVIPVTAVPNKVINRLSDIAGGFKLGVKHMIVEFTVPPKQRFSYGFSSLIGVTVEDQSAPNTFDVVTPQRAVAIQDATLAEGREIFNKTNNPAVLRLYIQVPMETVSQTLGSNFLVESVRTVGAVFDPAKATITGNGNYIFLGINGTTDTVDLQGYSHRFARTIKADQAVRFKYLSTMAQSISFGLGTPLDHTDVSQYESAVISAKQTRLLIASNGNVVQINDQGFTNIDRIDIREGVYIEAAIDSSGTGLIITQMQYPNDDLSKRPVITARNALPNVLVSISGPISVHVSGINVAQGVAVHLTDIYDVVTVVDPISCADNSPSFSTQLDSLSGTVSVNDAEAIALSAFVDTGWGEYVDTTLTLNSINLNADTRLRIRSLGGFITETQLTQENKAFVLYDRLGNIIDITDSKNFTVEASKRGIRYNGLDVCLQKQVCPVFDMTNAKSITNHIDIDGKWQVYNDCINDGEPLTVEELKVKVETDHPEARVHILNPIDPTGALPTTEPIDLSGRWYIEVEGEIFSSDDYSVEELKVALVPFGIDVEIL